MRNFKNYYQTKQFAELANVSSKSLGRLKKKLLDTNPETVNVFKKYNKNYYHFSLLQKFVSEDVYKIYAQDFNQEIDGVGLNENDLEI